MLDPWNVITCNTQLGACGATEMVLRARVVGMNLRARRRTNQAGSVVSYLQLAHNGRSAETGTSSRR